MNEIKPLSECYPGSFVHTFPPDEKVVSMIQFNGMLLVATEKAIYRMVSEEKLVPIPLDMGENEGLVK